MNELHTVCWVKQEELTIAAFVKPVFFCIIILCSVTDSSSGLIFVKIRPESGRIFSKIRAKSQNSGHYTSDFPQMPGYPGAPGFFRATWLHCLCSLQQEPCLQHCHVASKHSSFPSLCLPATLIIPHSISSSLSLKQTDRSEMHNRISIAVMPWSPSVV